MRYNIFVALAFAFILGSCQKTFLQMPITNTTTADTVFANSTNAFMAVSQAYRDCLKQGIVYQDYGSYWNASTQANMSGEFTYGFSYSVANSMVMSGYTSSGAIEDMDGYNYNFTALREAYLVRDNIDKVSNMSASDKEIIKAEMQALAAYRYGQMMIIFGGVPIVTRAFEPNDELAIPRSPLKEVLDSVVSWCDQAAAVLPSSWPGTYMGRMTKGAVLAIKAKALMYAARPLFNTGTPYLNFGSDNDLLCLGNADPNRWKDALDASEAVIAEAEKNGGVHIINTGNPFDDYGTATSTPGNPEIILAFKFNYGSTGQSGEGQGMSNTYNLHSWPGFGDNMLTYNFLANYYKADGTEQTWPDLTTNTPFSDYLARMKQMEPRFLADYVPWQSDAANNPGDSYWANTQIFQWGTNAPAIGTKFFYKAGTRGWFEFPIFRLAAYYLSSAEAYNELGQTQQALARLNVVHTRAGLPDVTETNQARLRTIIQREWAIEFHAENYRLHDVKHWKLANIGDGIIGGPIYGFAYNVNNGNISLQYNNTDYQLMVQYNAFWAPKQFLSPFPQTEVNKGVIIQNPGY